MGMREPQLEAGALRGDLYSRVQAGWGELEEARVPGRGSGLSIPCGLLVLLGLWLVSGGPAPGGLYPSSQI